MIESSSVLTAPFSRRRYRRSLASSPSHTPVLLLFLVLNALDILTTMAGLRAGGREGNPLGVWVMQHGEQMLYLLKAVSIIVAWGLVVWKPRVVLGIWVGNVVLTLIVVNNMAAIAGF